MCSETSCLGILPKISKKTSIAEFFFNEFFRECYFEFLGFFQKNILLFLAFILLMTVSEVGGFPFTQCDSVFPGLYERRDYQINCTEIYE